MVAASAYPGVPARRSPSYGSMG